MDASAIGTTAWTSTNLHARRIPLPIYTDFGMMWAVSDEWRIVLSAEVERWYAGLSAGELAQADQALDRLATEGITLGMPHNRYLSEKLWELRFRCGQVNQRITYTADPDRQLVTLTTFRKQRQNERTEITRARKALRRHQTRKG